jgi:hypothetical protein
MARKQCPKMVTIVAPLSAWPLWEECIYGTGHKLAPKRCLTLVSVVQLSLNEMLLSQLNAGHYAATTEAFPEATVGPTATTAKADIPRDPRGPSEYS